MEAESIKDFYKEKTIFLTGAVGYLGSLFLAKFMRLGNVKEILILLRPKKGKSSQERLKEFLSGFLFQEMEKYDPEFLNKLKIINGDIQEENLGMSDVDREYIKNNIELIIHCAATVRFDEQIKTAMEINVRGTKFLLDIATEVKNLEGFLYISTAYSQCPRFDIKEIFYESPINYRRAMEACENFDEDLFNGVTAKLIAPWPNTYTFTKAIAEDLIREYSERLPIVVIRPSVGKIFKFYDN